MDKEFSDYKKIGIHLNQFMGSSSSIGAKRVRNVCVAFRAASEQNNRAGWVRLSSSILVLPHLFLSLFQTSLHFLFLCSKNWQLFLPFYFERESEREQTCCLENVLPSGILVFQVFESIGAARAWVLLPQKQIARTVPCM